MNELIGKSWKLSALRQLSEGELRAFSPPELESWLAGKGFKIPQRTALRALQEWELAGLVERVATGLYLNKQAVPVPLPEEAAAKMRSGAVVSLATVLGRAGVLNNPTHWVTAVVPTSESNNRREVGMESGHVFRFAQMRSDLVPQERQGWARDALEPYTAVPTATPEKALLDWLYLTTSSRGKARWPLPAAHDWDISALDDAKLNRLGGHMGLEQELAQFQKALELDHPRVQVKRFRR